MNFSRNECIYGLFGYAISVLLALPFSVGLPLLFWELLSRAIRNNGSGGGMFYFPTMPDELCWFICWLVFTFPFLVAFLLLAIPTAGFISIIGVDSKYVVPVSNGSMTIDGSFLITESLSFIVQILFWGTLIHLARTVLRRPREPSSHI